MGRRWTPQESALVSKRYAAEGPLPLAAELGRSPDSVSSLARRYGIASAGGRKLQAANRVIKSRTVNVGFFDTMSAEVAFVLGFVWACGSVKTKHRKVLRMVLPQERREVFPAIQHPMGSRHLVQTYEHTRVLEICNSRLVQSLLDRHGPPPASNPTPDQPRIPPELVRKFAAGHLLATGHRSATFICWLGHNAVIEWLSEKIQTQARVPPPQAKPFGSRSRISWTKEVEMSAIEGWMERPG
jgi:hypothetical protein